MTWEEVLKDVKESEGFRGTLAFVNAEKQAGKIIYPLSSFIFNAFKLTPFEDVRIVILGQDPYHGAGQAHGLCFSVQKGIRQPPSLQNIFKEIHDDLGLPIPQHGNLEHWARQGVFLLNSVMTVEQGRPTSHAGKGWEEFTDTVIGLLSEHKKGLVFLLWGSYAQNKRMLIDETKHTILLAPHPSPFSASRGFFGCKHFSRTNEILIKEGYTPVDWSVE
jgi:uracil-DNA glycosylase